MKGRLASVIQVVVVMVYLPEVVNKGKRGEGSGVE